MRSPIKQKVGNLSSGIEAKSIILLPDTDSAVSIEYAGVEDTHKPQHSGNERD